MSAHFVDVPIAFLRAWLVLTTSSETTERTASATCTKLAICSLRVTSALSIRCFGLCSYCSHVVFTSKHVMYQFPTIGQQSESISEFSFLIEGRSRIRITRNMSYLFRFRLG